MKRPLQLFPHIPPQETLEALRPPNPKSHFRGKVFCIGFNKTGTSSLSAALNTLGFHSHRWHHPDHYYTYFVTDGYSHLRPWYQEFNFPFLVAADDISWLFHHPQMLQRIKAVSQRASSFGDYPWSFFYRIFNEWFPDSKFIFSKRNSTYDLVNSSIRMALRIQWNHYGELSAADYQRKIYGIPLQEYIMLTARAYERHNENVLRYFQSDQVHKDQLLDINLEGEKAQPWKRICDFLECPIPDAAFPYKNAAPVNQTSNVLPLDFDLNWQNYTFEAKYQSVFDLAKALQHKPVITSEDWKQLRSLYCPFK